MELPTISDAELRSRSRGILLGMACGESIAGTQAFTHLALELGESVVARGAAEPELLLDRWAKLGPELTPRPGSITTQALRLFREGFPAQGLAEATARVVPDRSGDGPLLRALPLAVAARREGALLKRWADQSAWVTHSDLTSRMATVGSCLLARDLLTRGLEESLARVAQALREEAPLRLSRAFRHPARGDLPESGDDAVAVLSQVTHALMVATDLEGTLQEVENQDQPSQGALALAGGLGGAAFGIDPGSRRLARLDESLRGRLEQLADRLVDFETREHAARLMTDGPPLGPGRPDGARSGG
ncbi:MAG TPA: ADP-ribosylglycohydrolase family protein [Candidatus Dormibacteraeota bacterium]|nr:ADP-ribosylglycohydrolase family protein [Candidatus Dormibacteraeota bacterium]